MKFNNKGFTLVELLAMLVVLGILMAISIPNITGILNQSKNNIIEDDVSKMVSTAQTKIATDEDIKKPAKDKCLVFTLSSLDKNNDYKSGPNGGEYDMYNSVVIVKRVNADYKYYVTLLEIVDGEYFGVNKIDYSTFKNTDIDIQSSFTGQLNENSDINSAKTDSNITGICSASNIQGFYK